MGPSGDGRCSRWVLLGLGLGLGLAGPGAGCMRPTPADTTTAGTATSTSMGDPTATATTPDPSTTSTSSPTTEGEPTTDGPGECDEGELYVCRLDASGECGEQSSCSFDYDDCTPGVCTEDCELECGTGWDCVSAGSTKMLTCARDYEEHCDLLVPDCPEGTKCMPWAEGGGSSWNALKCAPLDPEPVGPGEGCKVEGGGVSGVDNCDAHSMCLDVDAETQEGSCIAFCSGTSEEDAECALGYHCVGTSEVLLLCLPGCYPLLQDCPDGDLCVPNGEWFHCVLDGSGAGGLYGDPCEFNNACDPGLYCLPPEYIDACQAEGCCTPWCDTSEPPSCPGDTQECISWYEEGTEPPGYENVGICGVPQ